MWQFSNFFFEIYEPTNSKLATKVDLYKIYAQYGNDVTSQFRSASSQYPLQCKQTEYLPSGLMYCLKNLQAILSFCKDFSVLQPEMTSLQKWKCLKRQVPGGSRTRTLTSCPLGEGDPTDKIETLIAAREKKLTINELLGLLLLLYSVFVDWHGKFGVRGLSNCRFKTPRRKTYHFFDFLSTTTFSK